MGVISSIGHQQSEIIQSLKEGKVNFARPDFDYEIVTAPVANFSVRDYTGRFKDGRYLSRGAKFAVAAAMAAIKNSGHKREALAEAPLNICADKWERNTLRIIIYSVTAEKLQQYVCPDIRPYRPSVVRKRRIYLAKLCDKFAHRQPIRLCLHRQILKPA